MAFSIVNMQKVERSNHYKYCFFEVFQLNYTAGTCRQNVTLRMSYSRHLSSLQQCITNIGALQCSFHATTHHFRIFMLRKRNIQNMYSGAQLEIQSMPGTSEVGLLEEMHGHFTYINLITKIVFNFILNTFNKKFKFHRVLSPFLLAILRSQSWLMAEQQHILNSYLHDKTKSTIFFQLFVLISLLLN